MLKQGNETDSVENCRFHNSYDMKQLNKRYQDHNLYECLQQMRLRNYAVEFL
jgi:hypothetical protein